MKTHECDGKWHSGKYLPHFNASHAYQHVTFHLADSLPAEAMSRIALEIEGFPEDKKSYERRKRLEDILDAGAGSCILRRSEVAEMTEKCLLHFDGERCNVIEWVVMPNHVHVLIEQREGWEVGDLVGSWKKWSARRIHQMMPEDAPEVVWQRDYWDRFIRNEAHFCAVVHYIHNNPVKARLVGEAKDYRWGSARLRVSGGLDDLEIVAPTA
ncbi:transposase [soil metagenome]